MQPEKNTSAVHGSAFALVLYDICEEIRLDDVRALLSAERQRPAVKHAAAEQLRIENPPIIEYLGAIESRGEKFDTQVKYYEYGVVSVLFQSAFASDWRQLVNLSANWIGGSHFEELGRKVAENRLRHIRSAVVKPYDQWLTEDYFGLQA